MKKTNYLTNLTPALLALSTITTITPSIALADDDDKTEHVIVSGSRIEQNLDDVAGSVTLITDEQIEHQLINNLATMFRYDPSITTEGNGSQAQAITVRGIGGNRLIYIKDGRRMNDSYAGGGGLLIGRGYFNTDNIKQVEVAKGAASSLYGSDGIGGIFVISTKDPLDYLGDKQNYLSLSAEYQGINQQSKVDLTGATYLGDWATSASAGYQKGHEVQSFDKTLPDYDSDAKSLLLKTFKQIDQETSVKLTFDYYQQNTNQVITPNRNTTDDNNKTWAISADFNSSAATSLYDAFNGQLYFSHYQQTSDQLRPKSARARGADYTDFNDYRFEQDIIGIRATFDKVMKTASSTHQLVYGLDYDQYDTTRPRYKTRVGIDGVTQFTNQPQKAFPGADTKLAGLFIQDNIDVTDTNLSLVAGLRFDYYQMKAKKNDFYNQIELKDINKSNLSPKLAAIYKFSEQVSIYGQYVKGFKIPPHDQAYQSHGVEPFYQIIPNNDLKSEKSNSYETGLKFNNDNLSFNISAYLGKFDNFIETKLVATEPTFIPGVSKSIYQYVNISNTEINGLELSTKYWLNDSFSLESNLAYTDGENKDTKQALTSISPLNGNVIVGYDFSDWKFTGALRFAKKMNKLPKDRTGQPTATAAGYGVVDLFAHYDGGNWKANIGITNLLDKEYIPYQSVAGQTAGGNFNQYTQPGRNFSIQLTTYL